MNRRSILIFSAAALVGCAAETAPSPSGGVPREASAPGPASLVGTWTGVWDNDPRFPTSLTIDRVTEAGVVEARYVFQGQQPARFSGRLEGRTFRFGTDQVRFTFTLQPDGRLRGSRQWPGGVNQVVLTKT